MRQRTLRWLDRAYTEREVGFAFVKVEPLLRNLHGDPRWAENE
jgi:hypothetical protein